MSMRVALWGALAVACGGREGTPRDGALVSRPAEAPGAGAASSVPPVAPGATGTPGPGAAPPRGGASTSRPDSPTPPRPAPRLDPLEPSEPTVPALKVVDELTAACGVDVVAHELPAVSTDGHRIALWLREIVDHPGGEGSTDVGALVTIETATGAVRRRDVVDYWKLGEMGIDERCRGPIARVKKAAAAANEHGLGGTWRTLVELVAESTDLDPAGGDTAAPCTDGGAHATRLCVVDGRLRVRWSSTLREFGSGDDQLLLDPRSCTVLVYSAGIEEGYRSGGYHELLRPSPRFWSAWGQRDEAGLACLD